VDRLADLAFVAVRGGGVDLPIPGVERSAHGVTGLVGGCLEDTEAEGGQLDAVVQGQERGSGGHDRIDLFRHREGLERSAGLASRAHEDLVERHAARA
jgi:hypothetical protein